MQNIRYSRKEIRFEKNNENKKKKKKNKEKTIELAPITQKVCCLENIKDFRRFVQALQKKTEITN